MLHSQSAQQLMNQWTQLAFAVPQVVSERLTRLSTVGMNPSTRDQKEFYTMGAEKVWAFYESWWAMGLEVVRQNQKMMYSMLTPWHVASVLKQATSPTAMQDAALKVVNEGVKPIRKKAVSNAKRLKK